MSTTTPRPVNPLSVFNCVYCVNYNCSHSQSQHVAYKEFAMVTISLWCVDSLNWFTGWG